MAEVWKPGPSSRKPRSFSDRAVGVQGPSAPPGPFLQTWPLDTIEDTSSRLAYSSYSTWRVCDASGQAHPGTLRAVDCSTVAILPQASDFAALAQPLRLEETAREVKECIDGYRCVESVECRSACK